MPHRSLTLTLTLTLGCQVVNAAQVAAMKHLSSLTLKVVGVTANSALVVGSCFLFGDPNSRIA